MKNRIKTIFIALCAAMVLNACSQTNLVEQGRPLNKEKVSKITEGVTTESQIVALFGEPTSKTVVNADSTKWSYKYIRKNSTINALFGETQYNIVESTLDMTITKGVVMWFNYNENNKQKKW